MEEAPENGKESSHYADGNGMNSLCTCLCSELHCIFEIAWIKIGLYSIYEGESKTNSKIHLTALIEVTVSNFTYHFSTWSPTQ